MRVNVSMKKNQRTREKLSKKIVEDKNEDSMSKNSKKRQCELTSKFEGFEDIDKSDERKLIPEHLEHSISFFPNSLHICFEFCFKEVCSFELNKSTRALMASIDSRMIKLKKRGMVGIKDALRG
ncbi:hypothetical protein M9H77_21287 [Catharanthus roseus]|uniref:Uncharacterized protein n=1 Tax=Catharanthus roseus TaxID=4058 RepID=A0ACC0AP86_CATRO|nr:hypothetical protein M9H77_21287 [Catharanthus roseus]